VVVQNNSADWLDGALVFHFVRRVVVRLGPLLFESASVVAPLGGCFVCCRVSGHFVFFETAPQGLSNVLCHCDGCPHLLADDPALEQSPVAT
jgi:hypothetical protein